MHLTDPEVLALAKTRRGLYLAALSAPRDAIAGLVALLAFDAELASIRAKVSEPMLGRIRLQWWRDELPGILGDGEPSHPVAIALSPLGLTLGDAQAFVDAHGFAQDEGPATIKEIEAYATARGGALARMMADVLGVEDLAARDSAQWAGEAFTLAEVLANGLRVSNAQDAAAVRALALDKIAKVRNAKLAGAVNRHAMPCLLPSRVAAHLLTRPDAPLGAGVVLSLWWASVTGRV